MATGGDAWLTIESSMLSNVCEYLGQHGEIQIHALALRYGSARSYVLKAKSLAFSRRNDHMLTPTRLFANRISY